MDKSKNIIENILLMSLKLYWNMYHFFEDVIITWTVEYLH
jgi:hypothetical protein